ncbi:MAG TPA: glycosyltransferase family 39 protein [Blastocatellia bacterium]|nr:glycosyltransferase family 39 protein [Blastocatellia bacterium]
MIKREPLSATLNSSREWIGARLAPDEESIPARSRRRRILIACAIIFVIAAGVRLLQWQDLRISLEQGKPFATLLIRPYQREVSRMAEDGGLVFPSKAVDPTDARMIVHPPGYSILLKLIYGDNPSEESYARLRLAQIFCDAATTVLAFLIAAELLSFGAALIGALMAAVSPHLAYYSLWLSPETFAALPILAAVYLIVKAHKRPRLITVIAAGAMIGLSCWLRSAGLLLAPLLAIALLFLVERGKRGRYAAALVGSAAIVIAPITIRNWVVYGEFIPLSIGSGITMIEGISDYDKEGRFGLPATDTEVAIKDAEWHNRPDYANNIWTPDGVARDRDRFARGASVIRSNPGWFSGVMLRRAAFMVRYNDSDPASWPLNTSKAPVVAIEPPFGRPVAVDDNSQAAWSRAPAELMADGVVTATQTEVSLKEEGRVLEIKGDGNEFQDQFSSAPIAVEEASNYVLRLSVRPAQGSAAVKVTSEDRRIMLASEQIRKRESSEIKSRMDAFDESRAIDLPFASGDRTGVRLVISNDVRGSERPVVEVRSAELFNIGPTPHRYTAYPRVLIRGSQKNIYKTGLMRTLIILGVALLAITKRRIALICLLSVPIYFLSVQSALHTEYRYVLVIHYFLFVTAGVAIYSFAAMMIQAGRALLRVRNS